MPLRELKSDIQPAICLLRLCNEGGVPIGLLVGNELRLSYCITTSTAQHQSSIASRTWDLSE